MSTLASSRTMEDSSYGVRSIDSSWANGSMALDDVPAASPSSIGSTSSDQTEYVGSRTPPLLASVARLAQTPGSPASLASFTSDFDHLSDAHPLGLLSDNEGPTRVSSRAESGSDQEGPHQHHNESQLVMPTLLLRANAARDESGHSQAARFGVIGQTAELLNGLFGSEHSITNVLEWPLDVDPQALIKRLEVAFSHAQRLLRDDIPRDLHGTLVQVLANLPELAGLDALVLPLDSPPSATAVELAAALHPFVNLLLVVRSADEEALSTLDSQLASQGIQWLSPCQVNGNGASFFSLPAVESTDPFQTSTAAAYPLPDLSLLRQRSLDLFLRWRAVDLAARSESDYLYPLKDAAFAEQVARRRARLADDEEALSSADSGAAADDEGAGQSAHLPRTRHARRAPRHCGPFDDPLSFDIGSVSKLGLRAAGKALRLSANIFVVSSAIVAIFGAGLGIGWISSTVLSSFYQAGKEWKWNSFGML